MVVSISKESLQVSVDPRSSLSPLCLALILVQCFLALFERSSTSLLAHQSLVYLELKIKCDSSCAQNTSERFHMSGPIRGPAGCLPLPTQNRCVILWVRVYVITFSLLHTQL